VSPRPHSRKRRRDVAESPSPTPRYLAERRLRRLLAAERGTPRIVPPADCQVALVYPASYSVAMSSLGFQMVYRWINDHPRALAERFFCDAPVGLSLENRRPLDRFDIIAFSVAYELEYLEVVRFLLENGVAPRAAERDPEREPLVLAGGVALLVNPSPIRDLADLLVFGDGEGVVGRLLDEWVAAGGDKRRFLESLARIEGVEVTEGAARRFGLDLGAAESAGSQGGAEGRPEANFVPVFERPDAFSAIVSPRAEFADRCLVEISRGCPHRCRFCFIGNCAPYRRRPFDQVAEMIRRGARLTRRFGLVAAAVGSHSEINRICEWCRSEGLDVSFSSLRIEDVTEPMLDLLAASGQQSVAVAPEAGTERLRRRLGKRLSDEEVIEFAARVAGRGLTEIRLYFMIGLPGEEIEDVEAIGRLVERVRRAAVAGRSSSRGRVVVAVNLSIFVPKPRTPLARAETPPRSELRRRLKALAALLGRVGGVEMRTPSIALAEVQRFLAWADERALDVLIEAARAGPTERRRILTEASRGQKP